MDWSDSADQAAFRANVRKFMHERLPPRYKARSAAYSRYEIPIPVETLVMPGASWDTDRMSDDPEVRKQCQDWVDALKEQGWVAAHWPRELGGAGLSTIEQYILNEERTIADAPRVGGTGAMFLGSLLKAGTCRSYSGVRQSRPGSAPQPDGMNTMHGQPLRQPAAPGQREHGGMSEGGLRRMRGAAVRRRHRAPPICDPR